MRAGSIRRSLAIALLAGVLLVALAASVIIGHVYEHDSEAAAAGSLRDAYTLFGALERRDVTTMDAALGALQADGDLRSAFLARDRKALLEAALPRFQALKERDAVTHMYFVDADRHVFLRVHQPDLFGDQLKRTTLVKADESGGVGAGLEFGQTAFALRVVRPWVVDGRRIGFMELAEDVNHFLVRMKQETGNDFGLLVKKEHVDRAAWRRVTGPARDTWDARGDVVVVDTTSFSDGLVDFQGDIGALPAEGILLEEELRGGRAFIRGAFPVTDAAGHTIGALTVQHDFTRMHQVLVAGRRRVLMVVMGMSLAACGVVWAALEWFALRHLARLLREAESRRDSGAP